MVVNNCGISFAISVFLSGLFSLGIPIGDTLAFTWTILQFPIYGLLLDFSKLKSLQKLGWVSISIIHFALIVIAMTRIDY
jgi:hypothetical protein